ncbi:MAG: O-antigen ligase family protein [Sedimentisphaerales bacterium]
MGYPASLNDDSSPWPYDLPPKEQLPLSIFLLMPFLVGAISVEALPGFNYLVVVLGVVCAVVFMLASVREGFFIPAELKFFGAFCLWGAFGLLVAKSPELVFTRLRTLAQLLIMALIVSYYARNTRCISWLFFAVLIGVLIIAASAVVTGDYKRAEVEGERARLAGLTMNANSFAIVITNGIAILLYFFRQVRSKILKLVIIGGILFGIRFVVSSGSRKGFIGVAILIFFWFLFTYLKELRKRPLLVIAMLLGVVAVGFYTAYSMRDTVLMQRFLRLNVEVVHGSTGTRIVMVEEGIRFTASHPVLGLGLNHFQIYSVSGLYAHNNYAEVFSTTGIPGGILYYLIYVIIFYRLHKVGKFSLSPSQRNVVAIFKCLMLLRLVLDLGVVSYYGKMDWIFLAIIIGGLCYLKRDVEAGYAQNDNTDEFVQNVPAAEY